MVHMVITTILCQHRTFFKIHMYIYADVIDFGVHETLRLRFTYDRPDKRVALHVVL